jgi:hypothetical protein
LRWAAIGALALVLTAAAAGAAGTRTPSVKYEGSIPPAPSEVMAAGPVAARLCAGSASGQPVASASLPDRSGRSVQLHSFVVVCIDGYRFVPGSDTLLPCPGYPTSSGTCTGGNPTPPLVVTRGTTVLLVVPDPHMHTMTSDNCPNVFDDPADPVDQALGTHVDSFNTAVTTAEQALFGQDLSPAHASTHCWFDTYPSDRATYPNNGGALIGPGYETISTAGLPSGTYHFYCQVHAEMRGTLRILAPRTTRRAS